MLRWAFICTQVCWLMKDQNIFGTTTASFRAATSLLPLNHCLLTQMAALMQ
jgi:hypothetical protein